MLYVLYMYLILVRVLQLDDIYKKCVFFIYFKLHVTHIFFYLFIHYCLLAEWLRCLPLIPGIVVSRPFLGHGHDSSYNINIGWFQEADSRVTRTCFTIELK